MKFNKNWTTVDKLNYLERMILIHSYLYYEMNETVIDDARYNEISRILAKKVERYRGTKLKQTMYGYAFKDFDGSTGFDLIFKLKKKDKTYIIELAKMTLWSYQNQWRKEHEQYLIKKGYKKEEAMKGNKKAAVKQDSNFIRDMLDGTLNRMMVTDDPEELEEQLAYAKKGLIKLYKANKKRLGAE